MKHQVLKTAQSQKAARGTNPCLPKAGLPLLAATALVLSVGSAQAALLASFVETFSGGGGGSANTSVYTLSSTTVSSFTKLISVTDSNFQDTTDDGYARLHRTATATDTNIVTGAYGVIELGDVGQTISIDAAFRHETGMSAIWSIQLDGVNVGGSNSQSYLDVSSFTGGDILNDSNILLSSVPATVGDTGRTPGPLTYTILAGDVGKALGLRIGVFDSTNNGTNEGIRDLLIDSISYSIPEPTTALLGGLGLLALLRRRR
ncbi:MAG: PEP-CTERM sorting domain-containing protein [Akkermansiaceae bacterium]